MEQEITNIWTNFQKELKGFIQKRTQNSSATEDILQDVFVKVIDKIDRIKQTENLRQYLYAIVRNAIADYYRQQKPTLSEEQIPEASFTSETSQNLNNIIADCCLRPFIDQLPSKYKEN